jgi:hypothetical protein
MGFAVDSQPHRARVPLLSAKVSFEDYRLCTNVQAGACRAAARCPLYEQGARQSEFLFGSARFRQIGRLTAFGSARRIVRIRTNPPQPDIGDMIEGGRKRRLVHDD